MGARTEAKRRDEIGMYAGIGVGSAVIVGAMGYVLLNDFSDVSTPAEAGMPTIELSGTCQGVHLEENTVVLSDGCTAKLSYPAQTP